MAWNYQANDGGPLALRHKHPVNVELSTYNGPDESSFDNSPVLGQGALPLAHDLGGNGTVANAQDGLDRVPDVPPCSRYVG